MVYDIEQLLGDFIVFFDYYGYNKVIFVGYDWGVMVVWGLVLLYLYCVDKVINLVLFYQVCMEKFWIEFMEELFGIDDYFVYFN